MTSWVDPSGILVEISTDLINLPYGPFKINGFLYHPFDLHIIQKHGFQSENSLVFLHGKFSCFFPCHGIPHRNLGGLNCWVPIELECLTVTSPVAEFLDGLILRQSHRGLLSMTDPCMYAIYGYIWCHIYHQYTPVMLAYLAYIRILWVWYLYILYMPTHTHN